jgi:hypothetical protein
MVISFQADLSIQDRDNNFIHNVCLDIICSGDFTVILTFTFTFIFIFIFTFTFTFTFTP